MILSVFLIFLDYFYMSSNLFSIPGTSLWGCWIYIFCSSSFMSFSIFFIYFPRLMAMCLSELMPSMASLISSYGIVSWVFKIVSILRYISSYFVAISTVFSLNFLHYNCVRFLIQFLAEFCLSFCFS